MKNLLCIHEGVICFCEENVEILGKKIPFVLRLEGEFLSFPVCSYGYYLGVTFWGLLSFTFLKILVTFAILDNAFRIIPSKTWLWLLMGHKSYYLISTHGKISERSCIPRTSRIYFSQDLHSNTLKFWGFGQILGNLWIWDNFLHWETQQWEVARKHAVIMLYLKKKSTVYIFT